MVITTISCSFENYIDKALDIITIVILCNTYIVQYILSTTIYCAIEKKDTLYIV